MHFLANLQIVGASADDSVGQSVDVVWDGSGIESVKMQKTSPKRLLRRTIN